MDAWERVSHAVSHLQTPTARLRCYDAPRSIFVGIAEVPVAMKRLVAPICTVVVTILMAQPLQAATFYGSPKFQQLWQTAEAATPNFWGPLATARDPQLEQYAEGQATQPCPPGQACAQVIRDGQRIVQYFDKGRMELNRPDASVTSGLLASDMVHGRVQISDGTFQPKAPPAIPLAGDADNPGPTYAMIGTSGAAL